MSLNDCNYNKTQHLGKKLAFLVRVDRYVEDAEKHGHPACAGMWRKIKEDEQRHVDMLKKAISGLAKEDKFH